MASSPTKLANMTLDELRSEVEQLRKRKKYGLVWEEKPEAVAEQCKAKLPVLSEVSKREVATDPAKPVNLLIEGDNYHALSVLNYTHHGKIDVIYIDPPYNTGARDWQYNNDYVDGEDSFRHSKWLSMMHKRLLLAKNLLSKKGFICCAIDHNELFTLGCLMDAIFGEDNRLAVVTVIHQARGRNMDKGFSASNEFMMVYVKTKGNNIKNVVIDEEKKSKFNLKDVKGNYYLKNYIMVQGGSRGCTRQDKPNYWYPIYVSKDLKSVSLKNVSGYEKVLPITRTGREMTWVTKSTTFMQRFHNDEVVIERENGNIIICRKFREQQIITTHWISAKYNATSHGTMLLEKIIGKRKFDFPKSLYSVIDFLKITSPKDSTILDFFAGSGTTGHAVLELNKEDGGNRQFILCTNNENKIAEKVTHPRIKKVIKGYRKNGNGEQIAGLGGNLKYYKTTFVTAGENDFAKQRLTEQATEMLCIKEAAFDEVKITQKYKIYRNREKHVAIIFTESAIENCKKCIAKIDGPCTVYVFSLGADADADEFDELGDKVTVEAIPEPILRIYRRLFK